MNEFIEHLNEVFREFGAIQTRRMFGGYGIYHQGLMFALVAAENLYLKSDEENVAVFIAADCTAFSYQSQGQSRSIAYYSAPAECFEDPSVACHWAKLAFAAAVRTQARKLNKKLGSKKQGNKKVGKKTAKKQAKKAVKKLRI